MRRECYTCLCRTCLYVCKREGCAGKKESCEKYRGFRQLCIFINQPPDIHGDIMGLAEKDIGSSQSMCSPADMPLSLHGRHIQPIKILQSTFYCLSRKIIPMTLLE